MNSISVSSEGNYWVLGFVAYAEDTHTSSVQKDLLGKRSFQYVRISQYFKN